MSFIFLLTLIGFFLFISFFEYIFKKPFWVFAIFGILLFLLNISLRSFLDTPDTQAYVDSFNSISASLKTLFDFSDTSLFKFEPGFIFLEKAFKFFISENVRGLFFFIGFLNCSIFLFYSRKLLQYNAYNVETIGLNKIFIFSPAFLIGLYISYFGLMYSGIVLRQSISMSLFFVSFYYLFRRKYILGYFYLTLSFFFHNMAFLNILIIPFLLIDTKYNRSNFISIWICAFLLYLGKFYSFLSPLVSNYIFGYISDGIANVGSEKITSYLITNGYGSNYSVSIFVHFFWSLYAIFNINYSNKLQVKILHIYVFMIFFLSILAGIMVISRVFDYYFYLNIILFYLIFDSKRSYVSFVMYSLMCLSNFILFYRLVFTDV